MGLPMDTELAPKYRLALFQYDFDVHGGAVGTVTVRGNPIPDNALITGGMIVTKTNPASSGSATIQLKAVGTDDVLASTAYSALTTAARDDIVPDYTASTSILTTAEVSSLTMTIGTAALTAGKFVVVLAYMEVGE